MVFSMTAYSETYLKNFCLTFFSMSPIRLATAKKPLNYSRKFVPLR